MLIALTKNSTFARLSCQQAEQIDHVQQAQAYREAAVFHLHLARCLRSLQELVRYYRLNDFTPNLKFHSEEHMAAKGQVLPEDDCNANNF